MKLSLLLLSILLVGDVDVDLTVNNGEAVLSLQRWDAKNGCVHYWAVRWEVKP